MARSRRLRSGPDYWPGFVDALSTMLLVFVFLITVFTIAQFYLAHDVSGKDIALQRLNKQIEELTNLLSLERAAGADAQIALSGLNATLDDSKKANAELLAKLDTTTANASQNGAADSRLDAEKQLSARVQAQVELLNQQIAALRKQLAALESALQSSESHDKDSQAKIAELGQRLNLALAQKVQELQRYRSDFFGRLREILGDRPGVKIVGDRFVFQSEVLFDSGQAALNPQGKTELDGLANAIMDLEKEIPPSIPWILRIDGHTDKKPIQSSQYPSNWALSAARSIAVVQYLAARGVQPTHLVAAGFGEYQPLDPGESDDAMKHNRRIEIKLTER